MSVGSFDDIVALDASVRALRAAVFVQVDPQHTNKGELCWARCMLYGVLVCRILGKVQDCCCKGLLLQLIAAVTQSWFCSEATA